MLPSPWGPCPFTPHHCVLPHEGPAQSHQSSRTVTSPANLSPPSSSRCEGNCSLVLGQKMKAGAASPAHGKSCRPVVRSAPGSSRLGSGVAEGHPPPQPPAQAVFDPALLPLLHRRHFVGRFQHRNAAAPGEGQKPRCLHRPTGNPRRKPAFAVCRWGL